MILQRASRVLYRISWKHQGKIGSRPMMLYWRDAAVFVSLSSLDEPSAQISKSRLSSDCALQLEHMKLKSLVIADQHAAVNTFPGLVHTARHTMGVGFT